MVVRLEVRVRTMTPPVGAGSFSLAVMVTMTALYCRRGRGGGSKWGKWEETRKQKDKGWTRELRQFCLAMNIKADTIPVILFPCPNS